MNEPFIISQFALLLSQGVSSEFNTKGVPASVLSQIEAELKAIPFGTLVEFVCDLSDDTVSTPTWPGLEVTDTWFDRVFNYGRQG